MLKYWYKEFPQFPASHRDYWRVRFVFHCLLITNILFLVLAIINFQYFNDFEYGLLDSAGFLLSATGYWMFTKYQNIAAAAGLFCVILTAIIVTFLLMIGGYAHIFDVGNHCTAVYVFLNR